MCGARCTLRCGATRATSQRRVDAHPPSCCTHFWGAFRPFRVLRGPRGPAPASAPSGGGALGPRRGFEPSFYFEEEQKESGMFECGSRSKVSLGRQWQKSRWTLSDEAGFGIGGVLCATPLLSTIAFS